MTITTASLLPSVQMMTGPAELRHAARWVGVEYHHSAGGPLSHDHGRSPVSIGMVTRSGDQGEALPVDRWALSQSHSQQIQQ
jgi:hypothetical protein